MRYGVGQYRVNISSVVNFLLVGMRFPLARYHFALIFPGTARWLNNWYFFHYCDEWYSQICNMCDIPRAGVNEDRGVNILLSILE